MALIEIAHLTKVFYPARSFGAWLRVPWQQRIPTHRTAQRMADELQDAGIWQRLQQLLHLKSP